METLYVSHKTLAIPRTVLVVHSCLQFRCRRRERETERNRERERETEGQRERETKRERESTVLPRPWEIETVAQSWRRLAASSVCEELRLGQDSIRIHASSFCQELSILV